MKDDRITHPEQLDNGTRYHVWYSIPVVKSKTGVAVGTFTDVFREFKADKTGFFLHFYEQPKVDWLQVTAIRKAMPGE